MDTPIPKFKIGDKVHCFRKETESVYGFDFIGTVTRRADRDEWEYSVTGAPSLGFMRCLIWESEMEKAE